MSILTSKSSKTTVSKSSLIEQKISAALGVFHKALNDLKTVRSEVTKHHDEAHAQIVSLEEEKAKLATHGATLDAKIAKIVDIVA